jgi:hypothetical protein
LTDRQLAAEAWRMQLERSASGSTSESHLLFLKKNPTMMQRFVEGLKRYIARLKKFFAQKPTAGLAARMSTAERAYKKIMNGGFAEQTPAPDPVMSHHAEFYAAITEGSEQSEFELQVSSQNGAEGKRFMDRVRKRFDNFIDLPKGAREIFNDLTGTRSRMELMANRFYTNFSKLGKLAIAADVPLQTIRDAIGDSSAPISKATMKELEKQVDAFAEGLNADTMTTFEFDSAVEGERKRLMRDARKEHNTAAEAKSVAARQALADAGHVQLSDLITDFRAEIDQFSARLGYDEATGVYITRTYQFFTTKGWVAAARTKGSGKQTFNGRTYDFDAMRATAAEAFEEAIRAEALEKGDTISNDEVHEEVVKRLDGMLEYLEQQSIRGTIQTSGSIKKDLARFMPKGELDARLRALMGEVDDPLVNLLTTYRNVGTLAANSKFLEVMGSSLLDSGIGSRTQAAGTVPIFGGKGNPAFAPIAGIFVDTEVARAIQAATGYNGRFVLSNTQEAVEGLMSGFGKFVGWSIVAKTLGSVGFYTRNAFSNQVALLSSVGISPINKHSSYSYKLASIANFLGKKGTTGEMVAEVAELTELQVIADSSTRKLMQEFLSGHSESDLNIVDDLITAAVEGDSALAEEHTKTLMKRLQISGGKALDFLQGLNGVIDDAVKIQVFKHELDTLIEAYKDDPRVASGDVDRMMELKREAANITKRTMPTHSQQWDMVRALNQSMITKLIFPFARWKTEVIRTTIGNYRQGVEEIKSKNPVLIRRGWRRISSATAVISVGSMAAALAYTGLYGLIGAAKAGLGFGDEEDKEKEGGETRELTVAERSAVRKGLPLWQQAHQLFIRSVGGDLHIIDMSSIMPHSIFTDPVALIIEDLRAGDGVNPERLVDYVKNNLIGTQIATGGVLNAITNTDDFGNPIAVSGEPLHEQVYKLTAHVLGKTLTPSVVGKVTQMFRTGEDQAFDIVVGELTGARIAIRKKEDVAVSGFRNLARQANAVSQLRYPVMSGRYASEEDVADALNSAQDASNRIQSQAASFAGAMQSLGLSRAQLAHNAKRGQFSKNALRYALVGKNQRWTIDKQDAIGIANSLRSSKEQDLQERLTYIRNALRAMPPVISVAGEK